MENENILVKKALSGNINAFEKLMRIYEGKIFALCLRYLKQDADARDAAQEAMIKIYTRLATFTGKSAFSTWVYSITKNTCLDIIRAQKPVSEMDSLPETRYEGSEFDPEKRLISQETKRLVMNIINSMPKDRRSVLVLRDIDGFSYEEIARILGITTGTVKSRLSRAREQFKNLVIENNLLDSGQNKKRSRANPLTHAINFAFRLYWALQIGVKKEARPIV